MRIRTQLIASAALAGAITLLVAIGLAYVTTQARSGLEEQADAQEVARDVANMLSLTNEFSLFGGERAASQWRVRHAQLLAGVDHAMLRRDPPAPELVELRQNIDDLPGLFEKLSDMVLASPSPLVQRRRDLLLERLLAETQEVVESRHRWAKSSARRRSVTSSAIRPWCWPRRLSCCCCCSRLECWWCDAYSIRWHGFAMRPRRCNRAT